MSFRIGLGPLAACCALIAMPQFAAAQSKAAVVNMQLAMVGTAEIKKADADMQAKYAPRQKELDQVNTELAKLQQAAQVGQDTMTAQAMADNQSQTARRQREVQRLQEDLQADFDRDKTQVLSGVAQRMEAVVRKMAEERSFDLVLDSATTLFFKDALDITKDVVTAYDKAYPVPAAAAAAK